MLDINGLKNKAVSLAKQKMNGFMTDEFPSMGIGVGSLESGLPPEEGYHWAGMTQQRIYNLYGDLKSVGVQLKNLYIVRFMPIDKDNFANSVPLLQMDQASWLATDVSAPIIQLDTDSKKAGHFTINHVTGSQSPEITLTFIETANGDVRNSLKALRKFMCKQDGTMALPSEYCFNLDVWTYGRKDGWKKPTHSERFIVFISQANLELAAADSEALLVPITFTQHRRFMKFF